MSFLRQIYGLLKTVNKHFKINWRLKKEKSDHICDHEELMFVQIKNKSFSQALDTSKQIGYYNLNSLNARGMYNMVRWVLAFLNQMYKISLNLGVVHKLRLQDKVCR